MSEIVKATVLHWIYSQGALLLLNIITDLLLTVRQEEQKHIFKTKTLERDQFRLLSH